MKLNGTTLSVSVVTLVLGSLLGAWYGARHFQTPSANQPPGALAHKGPNYIRLEIDPTGTVVLAPQVGDLIEWYPQRTANNQNPDPAFVKFRKYTPCQGQPGQTIAYCSVQKGGHFEYKCDPPSACVDPGMDPRSQTQSVLLARPGGGGVTPVPIDATGPPPLPRITIDCDNQNPSPDVEPIQVLKNQKIPWIDAPGQDFTITTTPPKFCAEDKGAGIQSYDGLAVCTATADPGKSATYTVKSACPNSGTFNIKVN